MLTRRPIGWAWLGESLYFILVLYFDFCRNDPLDDIALKNKFIVEAQDIIEDGVNNQAFSHDEIVLADETWTRICAPSASFTPVSIIFWNKCDPNDSQPTPNKIVSTFNLYCMLYI